MQREYCNIGRGSPGQQHSPGGLRGRGVPPPPPPPPPPAPVPHAAAGSSPTTYPVQWTSLNTQPNAPGGGGPLNGPGGSSSQFESTNGHQGPGGHAPSGGGAAGSPGSRRATPHRSRQEEQDIQAALHNHLQISHNLIAVQTHGLHLTVPGSLYRSSCYRPTTNLQYIEYATASRVMV